MSKKLYDHIISTNYGNIDTKIKKEKKKSQARKTTPDKVSRAT